MIRRLTIFALLVVCVPMSGRAAQSPPGACDTADDMAGVSTPLTHVAAVLKPNSTLQVLAIGSSTIFGPEASLAPGSLTSQALSPSPTTKIPPAQVLQLQPSDNAFPQRMARLLELAVPGVKVVVTVRGGRGLTARDQLQMLDGSLSKGPFQLVLWQTGTVEAVRNLPPAEFATTLAEGTAHVQQAGADLILIDPQFSRVLQTNTDIEPYEQAFQQLGSVPGVVLFHRFDLMRSWANNGQIDLERTPKQDRRQAVEQLHSCLGEQLSRIVLAGVR